MKNFLLFSLICLITSISSKVIAGGGGICSPSDNAGAPTSVTAGTTYSYGNTSCTSPTSGECTNNTNGTGFSIDICDRACGASCADGDNAANEDCRALIDVMGATASCTLTYCQDCGSPENTSWAQFCPATTGTYTFTVSNVSCSGGGGTLQWSMFANGTYSCGATASYCDGAIANGTASQSTTLSLTGGTCTRIVFDGNAGAGCTWNFNIAAPPLPVKFMSFSVEPGSNGMLVKWSTGTETNNKSFTVERSLNGSDFLAIGSVTGAGNSTTKKDYAFFDDKAPYGFCYYRIKQTDFDNKFEYSDIVAALYKENRYNFEIKSLYPSTSNEMINIIYTAPANKNMSICIYNTKGKKVKEYTENAYEGRNDRNFDISGLDMGIYYFVLNNGKEQQIKKFIKY